MTNETATKSNSKTTKFEVGKKYSAYSTGCGSLLYVFLVTDRTDEQISIEVADESQMLKDYKTEFGTSAVWTNTIAVEVKKTGNFEIAYLYFNLTAPIAANRYLYR
jgi:hypothetical protein